MSKRRHARAVVPTISPNHVHSIWCSKPALDPSKTAVPSRICGPRPRNKFLPISRTCWIPRRASCLSASPKSARRFETRLRLVTLCSVFVSSNRWSSSSLSNPGPTKRGTKNGSRRGWTGGRTRGWIRARWNYCTWRPVNSRTTPKPRSISCTVSPTDWKNLRE